MFSIYFAYSRELFCELVFAFLSLTSCAFNFACLDDSEFYVDGLLNGL